MSKCKSQLVWDDYDCALDFVITENGLRADTRHDGGFAYMWSGGRSSWGVTSGKHLFECRVMDNPPGVNMPDTPPGLRNILRIGWSIPEARYELGEAPDSWGFGGTGTKSASRSFTSYGVPFGPGDVVAGLIDLDARPATIEWGVNGKLLGTAFTIPQRLVGKPFFPHVYLKNIAVDTFFGFGPPPPWSQGCPPGYSFIENAPVDVRMGSPIKVPTCSTRELVMMVGMPASGKTTWAKKRMGEDPLRRYDLLSTDEILNEMRVQNLRRKSNFKERFERLMSLASGAFNELLKIAPKKNRNFILDQTNVFPRARAKKLRGFQGFRKIAWVVVPSIQEAESRTAKEFRQSSKEVPEDVVANMGSNFTLPEITRGGFDEIEFKELSKAETYVVVEEMSQYYKNQKRLMSAPGYKKRPRDNDSQFRGGPQKFARGGRGRGRGRGIPREDLSFENAQQWPPTNRVQRGGGRGRGGWEGPGRGRGDPNRGRGGRGDSFSGRGGPAGDWGGPARGRGGPYGGPDGQFRGRGGWPGEQRGCGGWPGEQRGRGGWPGEQRGRGGWPGEQRGRGGWPGEQRGRGRGGPGFPGRHEDWSGGPESRSGPGDRLTGDESLYAAYGAGPGYEGRSQYQSFQEPSRDRSVPKREPYIKPERPEQASNVPDRGTPGYQDKPAQKPQSRFGSNSENKSTEHPIKTEPGIPNYGYQNQSGAGHQNPEVQNRSGPGDYQNPEAQNRPGPGGHQNPEVRSGGPAGYPNSQYQNQSGQGYQNYEYQNQSGPGERQNFDQQNKSGSAYQNLGYPNQSGSGNQNPGYPNQSGSGNQNPGYPNQSGSGKPNPGYPNQSGSGNQNSVYPNKSGSGNQNPGYPNQSGSGKPNPGYPNQSGSGNQNSVYPNKSGSGNQNPGYPNQSGSGKPNPGYPNQSDSGNPNPGYPNQSGSGNQNPGYPNQSGSGNQN
eukprot:1013549_1